MMALRKMAPEAGLVLSEVEMPRPAAGEVLVRVAAAGICGTDLHIDAWTGGYEAMSAAMPITLGHEFTGRVVQAANGTLPEGQRVVIRPSVVCGDCVRCRADQSDMCVARTGIGILRDGGFASHVSVPALNCLPLPDGVPDELGALTEPLTVAAEAVDTAGIEPGHTVLILGPGTIGQGIALFAESAGAERVVIVGHDDAARLRVLNRMGFADTVDSAGDTLLGALTKAGLPLVHDRIIEATGSPSVVAEALELLAVRGVLTICGIHPRPAPIDLTRLVRRHQQIRGSYRSPLATWTRVIAYLERNGGRAQAMISAQMPLSAAIDGFALAASRRASKVLLRP